MTDWDERRPAVLLPEAGPGVVGKRFLANARLATEAGDLIVVDAAGTAHRFPIDGTSSAAAELVLVADLVTSPAASLNHAGLLVLAGDGTVLAHSSNDAAWPSVMIAQFAIAAGLRHRTVMLDTAEDVAALPRRTSRAVHMEGGAGLDLGCAIAVVGAMVALVVVVAAILGEVPWWTAPLWAAVAYAAFRLWDRFAPGRPRADGRRTPWTSIRTGSRRR